MSGVNITVNGTANAIEADAEMPLLWVLRDVLRLKGTKYGCGVGRCGICTVLIDGAPNHACMVPLARAAGTSITTIEGLAQQNHPLVRAWVAEQVPQCGYCQGGQLLAAAALLAAAPHPNKRDIDDALSGILCRCGTYQRIRRAIARAAEAPDSLPALPPPASAAPDAGIVLNDWVRVHGDDTVTVQINHSELGQGALTGLAMLAAEELELEPGQVRTEFAPADAKYGNGLWGGQFTGGSSSIRGEWERLRKEVAAARMLLIEAAARRWKRKAQDLRAERAGVLDPASGQRLGYGALAAEAAKLPARRRVTIKPLDAMKIVGRPYPRLDIPDMATGRLRYSMDVTLPGMLVASVARPPAIGSRLKHFADEAARNIPGVHDVFAIDSGVAVVADDFWAASRGRQALDIEWVTPGNAAALTHEAVYAELDSALAQDGKKVRNDGNAKAALRKAERIIEARYRTPFLAHVPLEPLNCVADVRADGCDVYVGTQSQEDSQDTAARLTGLPKHQVRVHTQFAGGGFGRRLETDFVADAVQVSQRMARPVQVVWTRADDLQHDRYRPAGAARLQAALDARGAPLAWFMRIAGSELVLEGTNVPYAIPNVREEHVEVSTLVPTGAWRSVGSSQNAFVIESFVDELAHAAGRDPFEFRRDLLHKAPRQRAVLERAAELAQWGSPLAPGRGRGIACYFCYGSWAAMVAEVSVASGVITVHRICCALDCGIAVNPDQVHAQLEGGIAMGLSAALKEEVRIDAGRVVQSSFADYPILTIADMPEIEIAIIDSREPPGGVGEPGVPPVAPAVANAVFAATGQRLRELPLHLNPSN